MKTVLIEKSQKKKAIFLYEDEINDHVQEIGTAVLLVILLLIACLFINPLIVFTLAGLVSLLISVVKVSRQLKDINYEIGNDLLNEESLNDFRIKFER